MRKSRTALLIAVAFVLAGCFEGDPEFSEEERVPEEQRAELESGNGDGEGDGEGSAEAGATATFVAVDIDFEEAPDEVPAGTVEFELTNEGSLYHNVVIENGAGEMVVEAEGGETATANVDLDPGEYSFHCDVPGHEGPMSGTLTVTE